MVTFPKQIIVSNTTSSQNLHDCSQALLGSVAIIIVRGTANTKTQQLVEIAGSPERSSSTSRSVRPEMNFTLTHSLPSRRKGTREHGSAGLDNMIRCRGYK